MIKQTSFVKVEYPKDEHSYPETMQDFIDQFANEKQCRDYLAIIRWKDGFLCPHCKNTQAWIMGNGARRCKECRKDISVIAGTTFDSSKIPLNLWFQAIWHIVAQKQGVSALGLSEELGIERKDAELVLKKLIDTGLVIKILIDNNSYYHIVEPKEEES